jgi:hypothetical protein
MSLLLSRRLSAFDFREVAIVFMRVLKACAPAWKHNLPSLHNHLGGLFE